MSEHDQARALRRRRMHERQAVVFGVLLAGLAVAGLGSAALYTETLSLPFLARPFSTPPAESTKADSTYCPPEGAMPVAIGEITVDVYNGSDVRGLAAQTSDILKDRGFQVGATENALVTAEGVGRIIYGTQGIAAAYTLWAYVPDAVLQLDNREDTRLDLVIGTEFRGVERTDDVLLDPSAPLVGPEGCTPFSEIAGTPPAGEAPPEGEGEAPPEGEQPEGEQPEGEAPPEGEQPEG